MNLPCPEPNLEDWKKMLEDLHHPTSSVTIALVGKYVALHDAYLSVAEALKHGGIANRAQVNIRWIDAEELTPENLEEYLHAQILLADYTELERVIMEYLICSLDSRGYFPGNLRRLQII